MPYLENALFGWMDKMKLSREIGGLGVGDLGGINNALFGKWLCRHLLWHKIIKSKCGLL